MPEPLFTGVCTALVTPFRDGSVHYEKLEALLQQQMAQGITAFCIAGTTGEAATLTRQEFSGVLSHALRVCRGRAKVIAGAGSNSTATAISLAKEAADLGADAVLSVTPYYNKATPPGLIAHFTAIADAVRCPVILYNVPGRTNVDIPLPVYGELSKHPNITGVKEASGDLGKIAALLHLCGDDLTVWSGNDDQIVPMMALGAKGVISVLSNLCPAETAAMTDACLSGDYRSAGALQCRYAPLISALFAEVNPIPVKAAMNLAGKEVGDPRLPLCPIGDAAGTRLADAMKELGLLAM